jgi:hypothetical protein
MTKIHLKFVEILIFSHGLVKMFLNGKGMGDTKYTRIYKNCTKAVTFWFFDDFRSKNGLPASLDIDWLTADAHKF